MNYDLVIVAHEKDFSNIKYIVEHASKNLDFEEIHLILSERKEYDESILLNKTSKPIFKHKETDIINFDKSRVNYRPNWIYQMFLKMLQNVTKNDNFLVIEADCLILKNIDFFEGNYQIFYFTRDQYNDPYFRFNQKLLGIGREYNHSFISEFMMYDKKVVKSMITQSGCDSIDSFLEKCYELISSDCYPADYELYGNFFYKYHSDKFIPRTLNWSWDGRPGSEHINSYSDEEILSMIEKNTDKDTISFHTWL